VNPVFSSLALSSALLLAACTTVAPKQDAGTVTAAWVAAFNSHDPDRVLSLYDEQAILWGTRSPKLAETPAAIRQYFSDLPRRPDVKITLGEHRVRIYGDMAISTGYYTVSDVRDGRPISVPARFSFTYRLRDGRWMIVDHHSSAVPT